jgi:hypothetical protein
MDLVNEFAALQSNVDRKMKIYADKCIENAIKALSMDNPSLYKEDMYKTMAKYQCTYTCCNVEKNGKKCMNPAVLRGYCEKHSQPTAYESMVSARATHGKARVMPSFGG